MTIETERYDGPFGLHREQRARPRRRHPTFKAAEEEAHRLASLQPGDSFIVTQEVARIGAKGGHHG